MTLLRASAAWRLFSFNWLPIGLMAAALALGLALTGFSIRPASMIVPLGAAGIYVGVAYYNVCVPHRRDPMVIFVLGSTAQLVLITLFMTPITYIVAAAGLPMADASLDNLDRALGLDWRSYFSFIYARPQLIAGFARGYGVIGWPIFGIPVALGMTRRYRRLQEFTLAFALALIATTIISVFVPALGTYDRLGIKPDPAILAPGGYLDTVRDLPLVRDGSLRELDISKLVGIVTFPSFHAAAAVLYLWALWSVWWLRPARADRQRRHAAGDADQRRPLFRRCHRRRRSGAACDRRRLAPRRAAGRAGGAAALGRSGPGRRIAGA